MNVLCHNGGDLCIFYCACTCLLCLYCYVILFACFSPFHGKQNCRLALSFRSPVCVCVRVCVYISSCPQTFSMVPVHSTPPPFISICCHVNLEELITTCKTAWQHCCCQSSPRALPTPPAPVITRASLRKYSCQLQYDFAPHWEWPSVPGPVEHLCWWRE